MSKKPDTHDPKVKEDIDGIRLCLLQLGQETEDHGLRFSALMIRAAASSLEEPPGAESGTPHIAYASE